MLLNLSINLSEGDFGYFRNAMERSHAKLADVPDEQIIQQAHELLDANPIGQQPDFVAGQFCILRTLIDMLEDPDWDIQADRVPTLFLPLRYFADPEDLIPDSIPEFGFVDDAIVMKLATPGLRPDIDAYRDFCAFRDIERVSPGRKTKVSQASWLTAKRKGKFSRIRHRRREHMANRSHDVHVGNFGFWR